MNRKHKTADDLIFPSLPRTILQCNIEDYGVLIYSIKLAATAVNPIAACVEHFKGIAESTSDLEISSTLDGIAFSDSGSIRVESFIREDSVAALIIVVMGESAFDIITESDIRVCHYTVSGFRYLINLALPSALITIYKQPIAP